MRYDFNINIPQSCVGFSEESAKLAKVSVSTPARMSKSSEVVKGWFRYIDPRLAKTTVRQYRAIFSEFRKFMPDKIEQLCREHIETYLESLKISNRSKNAYLHCIKSFCRWMSDYGLPNPCEKIRKFPELPPRQKILGETEFYRLIAACKNQSEVDTLKFLAMTGLRASEFAGLKRENVNGGLLRLIGKGRRLRNSRC